MKNRGEPVSMPYLEKERKGGGTDGMVWILLVGILCLILNSCCWVAAGGAGYKVGTDERSVGAQASDAGITAAIKARLVREKGVRSLNIDVDCVNGRVTLTGIVKNKAQMRRVVSLARSVEGVRAVTNNLKLRPY